jgi:uncharacterized membrane protein
MDREEDHPMGCGMTMLGPTTGLIWTLGWLAVVAVVLAAVVAVGWWRVHTTSRAARASEPMRPLDEAEAELRHRYALGQIDREDFLQRSIDLER